jgi:hypothetical protein
MNKRIKRIWLEALRSDEYKQGLARLCRHGEKFCCLGVLGDIAVDGYWKQNERGGSWYLTKGKETMVSFLSINVMKELGLPENISDKLVSMNDAGVSFKDIADYIETHL